MTWITLTEDDVLTRLAGPELSAYRTAAKAAGQADPLPEIISGAVQEARGRVAKAGYTSDDEDAVPEQVKHHVLAIIRYRLVTRLPLEVKESRRKEYEDALQFLREVAAGDVVLDDAATGTLGGGSSQVISSRARPVSLTSLKGL